MKKTTQIFFPFKLIEWIFLVILSFGGAGLFAQSSDSVIFKDNFNRKVLGNFWKADASWSIREGSAYNFIDGTGGTLKTAKSYSQASYIIETKAKGFTGSYMRDFRLTFGQGNLSNDSMYVIKYTMNYGGRLTLGRSSDNVYYPLTLDEAAVYPDMESDKWYTFKITRYKSGLIQVYVDKGAGYGTVPLLETIDTTYNKMGHAGWQIDTQTAAEGFYVDNISARKPAIEKPAVRENPAEDNLITQVSAASGRSYTVSKLRTGVKEFTDRNYTITSVPSYLDKASFIQTANDDKKDTSDNFLRMFLKKAAIVYIGYDPRGTTIPAWLTDWKKTGDRIETTDPKSPYLEVYSKLEEYGNVYPYPLLLGGNLARPAAGAEMNYLVAAVVRPEMKNLQAENAFLSGAVTASNHPGYNGTGFADFINASNDYIEWTVKIDVPGVYSIGFKYANKDSSDRPLQINNDGTNIGIVPFSPTSSWSSWSFYSGLQVFLAPGTHKIRATAAGSSGPNIDEMSLFYTSSSDLNTAARKDIQTSNLISHLFKPSVKAFPNPFTESTTICYSLLKKANVVLSVYTLQGQRVQILVNGIQDAGNYQATFNAGKFSAGNYFYQLQTGNEVKTGKLLKE